MKALPPPLSGSALGVVLLLASMITFAIVCPRLFALLLGLGAGATLLLHLVAARSGPAPLPARHPTISRRLFLDLLPSISWDNGGPED